MNERIKTLLDSTSKRCAEKVVDLTGYGGRLHVNDILPDILQSNLELLAAVRDLIEEDRVELRDESDHLPAAYQYLKGKNDLRDKLLTALSEGNKNNI